MNEWSQQEQLEFLEALQKEAIIWDPKHADHRDKKKIHDAWLRLEGIIGKPINELKSKKDSLMATYRGYRRKISTSMKSGVSADDVYKPVWFAYNLMNEFLGSVYNCGPTIKAEGNNTDDNPSRRDNESDTQSLHETLEEQDDVFPSSSNKKKTIRRHADPTELQDAAKQMKTAFETLNNFLRKKSKSESEDECDLFGKLISIKLKRLPQDEREDVMFEIERIFHNRNFLNRRPPSNSSRSSTSPPVMPVLVNVSESPICFHKK